MTMRCSRCHLDKPAAEFAPSMLARGVGYCRPCRREQYAGNVEAERERNRARSRARRAVPELKAAEIGRERARRDQLRSDPVALAAHARRERNTQLLRYYGIGLDEYEARLAAQGGKCACCGAVSAGAVFRVDHDHATGAVRGLLCHRCNTGIGMLGDTADGVAKALAYLQMASGVDGRANTETGESPAMLQ